MCFHTPYGEDNLQVKLNPHSVAHFSSVWMQPLSTSSIKAIISSAGWYCTTAIICAVALPWKCSEPRPI